MADTPQFRRAHFIINPAAGGDEPILNTINSVLADTDIEWTVDVTQTAGDGARFAQQAAERGVDIVLAYGGDGTLLDVAEGLVGGDTPVGFLPGGTANAMVDEMGIPRVLHDAVALLTHPQRRLRAIDVINLGERYCLLRAGTGIVGALSVTREQKDRLGIFAYLIGGFQAITNPKINTYRLTIDGETYEMEGIACLISNGAATGTLGMRLGKTVHIDDGLLDVFVMKGDLMSYIDLARTLTATDDEFMASLKRWSGAEIVLDADEPEDLFCDGEEEAFASTPATIRVEKQALKVLVHSDSLAEGE